ncbi:hypothetical protein QVD17_15804 [Tagetes erecta]|uniref:Protein kinase domain-containing protein n=1 Tax=Tagetes erecta TaxID=13708 RepID=A0AAD8KTU9_TARER|nr:hypothetical protein QVD17_15804 [Tagetes erecta]
MNRITNPLLFISMITLCISVTSSLNSDGLSLLALKAAITGDPTNALITWKDTDLTPCYWTGISCNSDDRVITIFLPNRNLTGYLPSELGALLNLRHVNLSYNNFSGEIPASYGLFKVIVSLDLSHNNLTGKIPNVGLLVHLEPTSFSGNPFLCGFPLKRQCSDPEAQNPRSDNPWTPENTGYPTGVMGSARSSSGSVRVPLISGGVSVVVGVMFFSIWVYRKKRQKETRNENKHENEQIFSVIIDEEEGQDGKFVVMDEGFGLELEDLLRATAYVVGKGKSGIVYKVVAGRGSSAVVVAVRRLSEGDGEGRLKQFEAEMESIGRVQHPNVVRLRGYYYASDEKLLVSDFISNGSLYSALHGGPANPLPPLSWASRLKIAQGVARGLAHIHEGSLRKHVHGNIKSSKILLDDDLQPFLSGFGLERLSATLSKSTSQKASNTSQVSYHGWNQRNG